MTVASPSRVSTKQRLYFVDHLRVLLTVLVVLFHLAITYGADGSWIYREPTDDLLAVIPLQLLVSVSQAFFMGFFFLISGFLTPGSFDRKGAGAFMRDRLVRLGIPLIVYDAIVNPLLVYTLRVRSGGTTASFWSFLSTYYSPNSLGSGPLWFIETLLIFAAAYTVWRLLTGKREGVAVAWTRMPGSRTIVGLVLALTTVTFLVRLGLPIGWETPVLHLQFPFFPQYILMFVLGIVAYRRDWLATLTDDTGRRWLWVAVAAVALFPVMTILGGAFEDGASTFRGGPYWQAFGYALFESSVCLGMVLGLTTLFRRRYNQQGTLGRLLAANAYTVYLIFTPVVVFVPLMLAGVGLHPLLKFVVASIVAVPLCFLIAHYAVRRIPLATKVL